MALTNSQMHKRILAIRSRLVYLRFMSEPPRIPPSSDGPANPSPGPPPIPLASRFARQAAHASLIGPVLAIAINLARLAIHKQMDAATATTVNLIVGGVSGFLILSSLILAIVALLMPRRYGRQGVVAPALGGLILNGALIGLTALAIPVFNRIKARAKANSEAQQAMRELQDGTRRELRGDTDVQPVAERLGKAQKAVEDLASQSGGDRARALRASSQYLQRMQQAAQGYSTALKTLQDSRVLDMSNVERKEQLAERKDIVRSFMDSNEEFRRFSSNSASIYKEELEKAKVSQGALASELAAFRTSSAKAKTKVLAIRETDRRLGEAMLGILDLLEENWGKWNHDPKKMKLLFAGTRTLNQYNAFMQEINAAATEQKRIQEELAAANQLNSDRLSRNKPK